MLQNIILVGRLVRDFDLRRVQSGKMVASNSIACERKVKNQTTGAYDKKTAYIPFSLWENQAENAKKYCNKGSTVALTGYLDNDDIQKEDGTKEYKLKFVCSNITYVYTPRAENSEERAYKSEIDNMKKGPDTQVPF